MIITTKEQFPAIIAAIEKAINELQPK